DGFKTAPIVAASGKALLVSLPTQTPFPVPQPPAANADGQGQRGQRGGGGGGNGGPGGGANQKFGIVDLATHKVTVMSGTAPAFSDDGMALVYLSTAGSENSLMILPIGGEATAVLKTADRLAAPAFSPDAHK